MPSQSHHCLLYTCVLIFVCTCSSVSMLVCQPCTATALDHLSTASTITSQPEQLDDELEKPDNDGLKTVDNELKELESHLAQLDENDLEWAEIAGGDNYLLLSMPRMCFSR